MEHRISEFGFAIDISSILNENFNDSDVVAWNCFMKCCVHNRIWMINIGTAFKEEFNDIRMTWTKILIH